MNLIPRLKHTRKSELLGYKELAGSLWYSVSNQSYIQRDDTFDSTWLADHDSDFYVACALLKLLKLDRVYVFEKEESCNGFVDALSESDSHNILAIFSNNRKESLFFEVFEFFRNAFAHGSFNIDNDVLLAINQHRPKPSSHVKGYLETKATVGRIAMTLTTFRDDLQDVTKAKCKYLASAVGGELDEEHNMISVADNVIFVDDAFLFSSSDSKQKKEEIIELFSKYAEIYPDKQKYIIVKESIYRFSEENLSDSAGNIHIVDVNDIHELFQINSISMRKDK